MPDLDLSAFLDILDKRMSADDLDDVCFDLGIDTDNLAGETKRARLRLLLRRYVQADNLPTFLAAINKRRPDIDIPGSPVTIHQAQADERASAADHQPVSVSQPAEQPPAPTSSTDQSAPISAATDGPQPQSGGSLLSRLRDTLNNRGSEFVVEAVVAVVVGLLLTSLVATSLHLLDPFLSYARYAIQSWSINRSTMSEAQALAIARSHLGPDVLRAIPFRSADSDWDYLAVITGTVGYPLVFVSVAEVNSSSFTPYEETTLSALDAFAEMPWHSLENDADRAAFEKYLDSIVGVYDVDRDLHKEVLAVHRDGKYSYGVRLQLYEPLTRREYSLEADGTYLSPRLAYRFTPPEIKNNSIGRWLTAKADSLNLFNPAFDPLDDAIRAWLELNGKANPRGRSVAFKGLRPEDLYRVADCRVDERDYTWISLLHGPVVGYDKRQELLFMIFVQDDPLGWLSDMVVGEKFVWLGLRNEDGIVAFDKESRILRVIPVPEPPSVDLRPGSVEFIPLTLQGTLLRTTHTNLTLPASIDSRREFASAKTCQ